MATRSWLSALGILFFLHFCSSQGFFDELLRDSGACEDICANTFPLHTYEEANHQTYCSRGCRLFTIINFVDESDNLNHTKDACALSCKEAYERDRDHSACSLGCDSQMDSAFKQKHQLQQLEFDDPLNGPMSPFLYVHNMYSNMVDKLFQQVSTSWSFYMANDDGSMVVVRSQPRYVEYSFTPEKMDRLEDTKTSNYIETNLAAVDNSATPNVKHSQMHAVYPSIEEVREDIPADWLSCIAKKTGLPRLLLSFTIFISAMVMIWLCFTTAVTAPEHRTHTQKLSINGDLEYLSELGEKQLLASVHPQEKNAQAAPLPIKIRVERV